MIYRAYIGTLTAIILTLLTVSTNAQDLLDDVSEAASEDLLLDASLDGDLLDAQLLPAEDLNGLDMTLELPAENESPVQSDELTLGDLEAQPADVEFDLSDVTEPVAAEPVLEEPMLLDEPVAAEPVLEEPMLLDEPVAAEPVLEEPMLIDDPVAAEPVLEEPMLLDEPVAAEPVLEEPMLLDEPVAAEPVLEEPMLLDEPVTVEPVLEEPMLLEKPVIEERVADDALEIDFNALANETRVASERNEKQGETLGADVGVNTGVIDDEMVHSEIMDILGEGIPAAPSIKGVKIEGLEEIEFTENLAILKRKAGEHHALDQLKEADQSYSEGDYEKAIVRYKYAYNNLGRRAQTDNDMARAKIGVAKSYYAKAILRYKSGEMDAAIEAARLARDYGHPKANKLIKLIQDGPPPAPAKKDSFVRQRVLNTQESKSRIRKVSDLLWLGRQRFQAKQYGEALEAFEAVLKDEPENTEAIRMRRKIGLMKYDRASEELESTREMMMGELRETWNPRHYKDLDTKTINVDTSSGSRRQQESPERTKIMTKMRNIMIPEIDFRQANINDVVKFLAEMSQEFDTTPVEEGAMRGVNLILNLGGQGNPGGAAEAVAAPVEDPFAAMGGGEFGAEAAAGAGGGAGDIPLVTFTARELSMYEALKIVTDYCNLKFHISGSVVMIVRKDYTDQEIIPRWYSVLNFSDIMSESAASMTTSGGGRGAGGGNEFTALDGKDIGGGAAGGDWRAFFEGLGVPWPQGSAIKYLSGIGKLMVANTAENLALFEQILNQFDFVPKQIEIEARFVEVNQNDLDSLGMELRLNDDWEMLTRKGDAHLPISARPAVKMAAQAPGQGFTVGNRFLSAGIGSAGLPINDSIMHIASVLTNPELDFVLHMMKQKGNSDLLSAPKVTAQSGSEATIKVVEEYIYPTEFTVSGVSGGTGAGGQTGGMTGAVVEPGGFETREVGVLLSVLPEVSAEGQMIMLTLSPEVCEFIRWEEYGSTFSDGQGNLQQLRMPQPIFHTRNVSTQIMIFNGATVVMGGMITEKRQSVDDKIPFLGDIPLIGRLFTSRYDQSEKRNLLVFVTARMVTPDGRAVKTVEEINSGRQDVTSTAPVAAQ